MPFLDINDFLRSDDAVLPFESAPDLSEWDPALSDVTISGRIRNIAGVFRLKAAVRGQYAAVCDRCLADIVLPLEATLDTVLAADASEDDSVAIDHGKIDLGKTAYDALILSIPTKVLCRPDCRGLCSQCGKNLNEENCECFHGTADPSAVSQ